MEYKKITYNLKLKYNDLSNIKTCITSIIKYTHWHVDGDDDMRNELIVLREEINKQMMEEVKNNGKNE